MQFLQCLKKRNNKNFFTMSTHKYKLQDKIDYPVRNPACGIYALQSLQLHSPPFQHLIRFFENRKGV